MKPKTPKKPKTLTVVNWLDLPRDLMIKIFIKLGTIELLYCAQRVCSSWRDVAKDPQLYRVVDFYNPWSRFEYSGDSVESVEKVAKLAVGRSRGQLVEFAIEYFCTGAILRELAINAPRLKCLRMATCNGGFHDDDLIRVIQKLPLLEEVEFVLPAFEADVLEAVGRSCPRLKSFRLNGEGVKLPPREHPADAPDVPDAPDGCNEQAFAIARCVNPGLKSLHLLGNSLNNDGLEAILERFAQLEYLDLRRCVELDLRGDLLEKCRGIKTLRLPDDSIEDYRFRVGESRMCDDVVDESESDSSDDG